MNRAILITSLVLMFGCSPTDLETLQDRGGVLYEINSEKPFSGAVNYARSDYTMKGRIKNGKHDGKWIAWYKNGQNKVEGFFEEGNKVGDWTQWHYNGQKEFEWIYEDGKRVLINAWDEDAVEMVKNGNGRFRGAFRKLPKGDFKDGRQSGYWQYDSYRGEYIDGEKDGLWSRHDEDGNTTEHIWCDDDGDLFGEDGVDCNSDPSRYFGYFPAVFNEYDDDIFYK
jgi:antitoxin component YwqK of YwqJK toxin-antitoxin module